MLALHLHTLARLQKDFTVLLYSWSVRYMYADVTVAATADIVVAISLDAPAVFHTPSHLILFLSRSEKLV